MRSTLINDSPILFTIIVISILITILYNYITTACGLVVLLLGLIWFYRLPNTQPHQPLSGGIYSACYGTVKAIETVPETGETYIITFLSLFDVHQQYYPVSGTIIDQHYDRTGRFHLAFNIDKSDQNEKIITTIQPADTRIPGNIIVQRIAGFLVRRITTENGVGDIIESGSRMGMIKFGSRVDVILPPSATVHVKIGQHISSNTLLASF